MTNRSITVLKANIIRNLRIDWKYKLNLVTDLAWLAVDVITFLFLGQMVADTDIPGGFDFDNFLKEFLVVGVIYWVIFTRAYKDGVGVIPDEAARGAIGFIITNDVSISELVAGQFSSSTLKTLITLCIFVLPIVAMLTIIPLGDTTILHPLVITPEILILALSLLIISWLFMLGMTIIASTINVIFKKSGPLAFLFAYLLTMTSGYFFPLEVLRVFGLGFIEDLLYFIPTTGMLYGLRYLLIRGEVPLIHNIIIFVSYYVIISLVTLFLALYLMKLVTRKSAYSGTLEFY